MATKDIVLSSFNHHLLYAIHQQRPEISIRALSACYPLDYAKFAEQLNASSVHLDINQTSEEFVNDVHQRALKVFVYTVDEFEYIETMKALGVDGIYSNFSMRSKNYLTQLNSV